MQSKNKKFWISFGILIIGLLLQILIIGTPSLIVKIGEITLLGLILSYAGITLLLSHFSEFKRSAIVMFFGIILIFLPFIYRGPYSDPQLFYWFYWVQGGACLVLGCLHALWTFTKSRRDTN
jgi:hypothetical protein